MKKSENRQIVSRFQPKEQAHFELKLHNRVREPTQMIAYQKIPNRAWRRKSHINLPDDSKAMSKEHWVHSKIGNIRTGSMVEK